MKNLTPLQEYDLVIKEVRAQRERERIEREAQCKADRVGDWWGVGCLTIYIIGMLLVGWLR